MSNCYVVGIVATHSHIDHVGAVKQVKEKTGAAFALHENGIFNKLMALPDETIVYSGHGPETTIGTERKGSFVLQWDARNA
ncbi:MBL fold metallo-hydrolase [Dehalococcoidia bacterium]|nr:MBL fold metallo-hydrolase [Dehalococcoidia bacterium]